jgi:hypothetical protein
MGDTLRNVLCGSSSLSRPLSTPARANVLPAPFLPPPAPAWPAGEPGARVLASVDRLVARIREMDAPVVTCAAPSCPRLPMPHGKFCVVCSDGKAADVAAELESAGWVPVMSGKYRRGWRDPVTGDVRSARTALEFVRRDALKVSSGKAGSP